MAVKVRRHKGTWYVFIDHLGQRKAKRVGSREAAESVRRKIEAQLALGDLGVLESQNQPQLQSFRQYTEKWMKRYAEVECKHSTVYGYKLLVKRHLVPEFGDVELGGVSRESVKDFAAPSACSRKSLMPHWMTVSSSAIPLCGSCAHVRTRNTNSSPRPSLPESK
jgi:hypothetical protein